jgi:hypothetical protein
MQQAILACWVYTGTISTGLGDRMGTMLSLSALARLHDAHVHMEWCMDPMRATIANPLHLQYIPKWTGWTYDLNRTRDLLRFPSNVLFSPPPPGHDCSAVGILGGHSGMPQTSTLYWKFLRMGAGQQHTYAEYLAAYKQAGAELLPSSSAQQQEMENEEPLYAVVHVRCPDDNTHARDEDSFCTQSAVRMLLTTGVELHVVSNSPACARRWVGDADSLHLQNSTAATAAEDMRLLLGAAAIIQHASEGWSSFSSVPAMAKGIPLLNTYTGDGHRFDIFHANGHVPAEFFRCRQMQRFINAMWARQSLYIMD